MKKTKLIFTALIALSFLAVLAFSGCSVTDEEYTVKYEIIGPATSAFIHYYNESGKEEFFLDNIPWEKTITVSGKDIFLYCSATRSSWYENTHTANIYVNGTLKATDTVINNSSGPIAYYRLK